LVLNSASKNEPKSIGNIISGGDNLPSFICVTNAKLMGNELMNIAAIINILYYSRR